MSVANFVEKHSQDLRKYRMNLYETGCICGSSPFQELSFPYKINFQCNQIPGQESSAINGLQVYNGSEQLVAVKAQ